ncbi:hypothetical protein V6N11_024771 [Hibiscus sabdariffa]|uniref:Uncharacterized protein n=1 Tax=Hibiscus sabdariffa TaxID=183260 RepID=A0ABR2QN39_9ROSI
MSVPGGDGVPPGVKPERCRQCGGSGMLTINKGFIVLLALIVVELVSLYRYVYIMPGVDNNETLKVYGSGGADPDRTHPGDLYVTVKVQQDPAILGGTIQVPTLKGDVVLKMVFNGVTRNVRECEGKFIAYSKSPYLMCSDRVLRQFNYHQPIPRLSPTRQHIHSAHRGRFDENWIVKQADFISVWEERHTLWAEDLSPLQANDFEFDTEYYSWYLENGKPFLVSVEVGNKLREDPRCSKHRQLTSEFGQSFEEPIDDPYDEPNFDRSRGWPSSWDSVEEQPSFDRSRTRPPRGGLVDPTAPFHASSQYRHNQTMCRWRCCLSSTQPSASRGVNGWIQDQATSRWREQRQKGLRQDPNPANTKALFYYKLTSLAASLS